MNNQEVLKTEKVGILLLKYSIPSILSMMITSLYNTVDRAFIGSIKDIGALAISGLGVTMPLFTILGAFCVSIAVGGSTNISIKLGEDNKVEAEKILGNMVLLEFVVGILIAFLGNLFLDDILYIFGASNSTIIYARDYMSVIFAGAFFNLPGFALNSAIRGEGNPKLSAKIMISSCILNLILDPIFIFKFNMGIKGAAIATVICQLFVFILSISYFIRGKSNLKLKLENIRIQNRFLKIIVLVGMTQFFMELASGFIHLFTNKILKIYGGDLSIGAMTIITSIVLMFLMPIYGISQGMQTIIAYNYGAGERNRVKKTLLLAILSSIIILTLGLILIQFFPESFIKIFTDDKNLTNLANQGLKINSITLPTIGVSILGAVYFQIIGESKISIFLSLLRQVILLIPILTLLPKIYGLNGVWISQPVADIISMIIVILFLFNKLKKKILA